MSRIGGERQAEAEAGEASFFTLSITNAMLRGRRLGSVGPGAATSTQLPLPELREPYATAGSA